MLAIRTTTMKTMMRMMTRTRMMTGAMKISRAKKVGTTRMMRRGILRMVHRRMVTVTGERTTRTKTMTMMTRMMMVMMKTKMRKKTRTKRINHRLRRESESCRRSSVSFFPLLSLPFLLGENQYELGGGLAEE